jgi:hypothetical protein
MTDKLLISAILILAVIFGLNFYYYRHPVVTVPQSEAARIMDELRARRAGNCECVKTDYGWRCESLEDGKVSRLMK